MNSIDLVLPDLCFIKVISGLGRKSKVFGYSIGHFRIQVLAVEIIEQRNGIHAACLKFTGIEILKVSRNFHLPGSQNTLRGTACNRAAASTGTTPLRKGIGSMQQALGKKKNNRKKSKPHTEFYFL